jgi:hypothetical protein
MAAVKHVKFFENQKGELWAALFAESGLLPELWIKNINAQELDYRIPTGGIKLERKYAIEELSIPPRDEHQPGLGFGLAYAWNRLGIHPKSQKDKSRRSIFLSYATEDREIVRRIYTALEASGHAPWMDENNLCGGMVWENEIKDRIVHSDVFIACLSHTALQKKHGFVQDEFEYAVNCLEYGKRGQVFLIPLLLDKCKIPDRMKHLHWVDYGKPDGLGRLLDSIAHSGARE